MKLLLSFPTQEDAESVMSALIKLQSGDAQAVHFGLLASRLARATVYGPLRDERLQENPCHTPNCFECLQVDVPLRYIEGKLICAECARYKYPGL
jgi:hypothetical protein